EVPINGRTRINILLTPQTVIGVEMVVVGYGEQKKENLTGSISEIGSEDLEMKPVNNTVQALQGLAPNLNIGQTEAAGASDASMNLNIRGTGSLSGSSPYILIDGVRATQSELSAMNPDAIKNISVLKDAAASAIYGAHAAYGVILVETKNGAKNQEFTIEYSNNIRFSEFTNAPEEVSSVKFAQVANEAAANYGSAKLYPEEQIQKMRDYIAGDIQNMT